jgi:hypothetical protein
MPSPDEVKVEMQHDEVDGIIRVPAAGVPAWEEGGWSVVDEKQAKADVKAAVETEREALAASGVSTPQKPKGAKGATKKPAERDNAEKVKTGVATGPTGGLGEEAK